MTTLMQTDLDLLAQRVEKATAMIQLLKEEKTAMERERDAVRVRLHDVEHKVQGHDVPALLAELNQLRKEQREWQAERREVASRIETLLKKLEGLDA